VLLRLEQRISARDAGQDHIDAIAEGHLAVVEQQHHRDRRARLDDLLKARADRLVRIGKPVGPGASLDRGQVAIEKPGPPDAVDNIVDFHVLILPLPACGERVGVRG